MDAVARALGADAVEFREHLKDERMRNVLTPSRRRSAGLLPPPPAGARYRVRNREGGYVATAAELSAAAKGFKGRTVGCCLRVRCDRQP